MTPRPSIDDGVARVASGKLARPASRRILMVSYDFPPSAEVGAQACVQIARHLRSFGWDPVVLTVEERFIRSAYPGAESVFEGEVVRTRSFSHPLDLYRNMRRTGDAVATPPGEPGRRTGGAGPAMRKWLLSLLTTPDQKTGWIPAAVMRGWRLTRRERIEHLFSSGPWWTNHLVGLALARVTGLPWTAHFRDPWTQTKREGPTSRLSRALERVLEERVIRGARFVVCVTERHTELLRRTYADLAPEKFVTIPNGYDGAEWESLEAAPSDPGDEFVVTYTGEFYDGRTPRPVLRALRILLDARALGRGGIRVDLIGRCERAEGGSVREMAEELGLSGHVRILPPVSRREALRHAVRSQLLLVLGEGLVLQIPQKTYEYLRAGRAILALTSDGALADLLRRTGGAWVVDPGNEAAIAAALQDAYDRWASGRELPIPDPRVVGEFDRRRLVSRFAALFDRVPPRARTRPPSSGDR